MKKQFVVIGQDIMGNVVWGAAPTLKEAGNFVAGQEINLVGDSVTTYIYLGKGKVTAKSATKIQFTDPNGKIAKIGNFDLTTLVNMED
jgi:hypothetical protein